MRVDIMVMTLSNYTGSADTFTWPHNPRTYDDTIDGNQDVTNIAYQRHHILVAGGGINPKTIVMAGHFDGTTKNTNYQALSKHFSQNHLLKKLYWETDKFHLGVGRQIKKTHAGGRTNFIDYVCTFETILGFLMGNTQRTSGTNAGNVTTLVEEITGTVTSGASDITITDNHGNQITIPSSQLTTGQAIVYKLVSMVDSGDGIYVSEYNYVTIATVQTRAVQVTDGFGILEIDAAENVSTISSTNLSTAVVKFRDGFSA